MGWLINLVKWSSFFVNLHYIKEINNKKILREGVRINLFGNRMEFFEEKRNSLSI